MSFKYSIADSEPSQEGALLIGLGIAVGFVGINALLAAFNKYRYQKNPVKFIDAHFPLEYSEEIESYPLADGKKNYKINSEALNEVIHDWYDVSEYSEFKLTKTNWVPTYDFKTIVQFYEKCIKFVNSFSSLAGKPDIEQEYKGLTDSIFGKDNFRVSGSVNGIRCAFIAGGFKPVPAPFKNQWTLDSNFDLQRKIINLKKSLNDSCRRLRPSIEKVLNDKSNDETKVRQNLEFIKASLLTLNTFWRYRSINCVSELKEALEHVLRESDT